MTSDRKRGGEWQARFERLCVREILEPVLNENGFVWGQYTRNSQAVLADLAEKGAVAIVPDGADRHDSVIFALENSLLTVVRPDYEIIPEGLTTLRFLKRGAEVKLPGLASRKAAMYGRISLEKLIRGTLDNVPQIDRAYSGFSYRGFRRGVVRKTRLADCIEGLELFLACEEADKRIEVKSYFGSCPEKTGARVNVRVPSRSTSEMYDFVFHGLPVVRKGKRTLEHYADSFDMSTTHYCGAKEWNGVHYKLAANEDFTCPHEVAGFYAAVHALGKHSLFSVPTNPYVFPTDIMLEYAGQLKRALKERLKNGQIGRGVLNKVQQEVMLWRKLSSGRFSDCFVRQKDWFPRFY